MQTREPRRTPAPPSPSRAARAGLAADPARDAAPEDVLAHNKIF